MYAFICIITIAGKTELMLLKHKANEDVNEPQIHRQFTYIISLIYEENIDYLV